MELLQQAKVIFYHPLDDQVEWVESEAWTKASGDFTAAKVGGGLSREGMAAGLSGLSAGYASAVGATRVAFSGWFRRPSMAVVPGTDSVSIVDAAALAVGFPEGDSVSLADTVGVGKLESDSAALADAVAFVVGVDEPDDITVSDTMAVFVGVFGAVVSGELVLYDDIAVSVVKAAGDAAALSDEAAPVLQTTAPAVGSPIGDGATSVSGTSSEANGTMIQVYKNGSPSGSTTTVASGAWTRTGLALATGDLVKAKATAPGKSESGFSNEVTVQAYSAAPVVSSPIYGGATSASGTSSETDGTVIQIYKNTIAHGSTTVVASGAWTQSGLAALSVGDLIKAKATAPGKLQSGYSAEVAVSQAPPSVGPQYEFYSAGAVGNAISIVMLGSGSFVVAYGLWPSPANAKVGIVSGDAISFGPEKYLGAGAGGISSIRAVKLDSTHVVFVWTNDGVAIRIVAAIVSGTDITIGSVDDTPGSYAGVAAAATDSTHFVLAYREPPFVGKACVVHVSGTTVSKGGVVTFFGSNLININVAAVSSTKVVVGYIEVGGWTGKAKVGTVSGVSIAFGSEATFESSAMSGYPAMSDDLGDGSKMVIAYGRSSPNDIRAVVGTVSGSSVSFGTSTLLATLTATYLDITALSSTRIMVAYFDAYNADPALRQAHAKEGAVSGTVVTFGPASGPFGPPNSSAADFLGASALSPTAMVVSYKDGSDAGHGTANVVTSSSPS